ncbi:MAG: pyruvate kinase [Spirochaetales bacterium]|nr:pyruvate kinase [Spirochaetales bacterium]
MKTNRTKIVATIGMHNEEKFIRRLYKAGASVFRLNTAHQTPDETKGIIDNIRAVSDRAGILIDTKGPEIRTLDIAEPIPVNEGDELFIVPAGTEMEEPHFSVSYNKFCDVVTRGTEILIDDGEMSLIVIDKQVEQLRCIANNSGKIKNKKSVNVPNIPISLPSLTKKDEEYIHFAAEVGVDFIAHSFVRNKEDLISVQKILDKYNSPVRLIAKIENMEGIENLDEILDHCHGVMVARGDLGIELPAEDVPKMQKRMIRKCIKRNKVVITATQMLHTMIDNPRPTRAEVSDVANAVMDGTDAVMLSGETAYGNYAFEAVSTMAKIAAASESNKKNKKFQKRNLSYFNPVRLEMITAAEHTARHLNAKAIIVQTDTGRSATLLASLRGTTPILALSPNSAVVRQLGLSYGVSAYHLPQQDTLDEMVSESIRVLLDEGAINSNDLVVLVGSSPNRSTVTNFIEAGEAGMFIGGRE